MWGHISSIFLTDSEHLLQTDAQFLMYRNIKEILPVSFSFYFYLYWHVFTGIEELQGPTKRVWSGLREIFNSIILNVITDASLILTNHKKKPFLPPGDAVFFLPFCLIWKILDDFVALFLGVETLRGERRSGYLSLPRLSTSNPIRSLTRLRVRLQTSSESLREDEQDDPEWSRSCSWCYRPAVSLCVFMLVSLHRLDTALRLAGGSAACRAAASRTEPEQACLLQNAFYVLLISFAKYVLEET